MGVMAVVAMEREGGAEAEECGAVIGRIVGVVRWIVIVVRRIIGVDGIGRRCGRHILALGRHALQVAHVVAPLQRGPGGLRGAESGGTPGEEPGPRADGRACRAAQHGAEHGAADAAFRRGPCRRGVADLRRCILPAGGIVELKRLEALVLARQHHDVGPGGRRDRTAGERESTDDRDSTSDRAHASLRPYRPIPNRPVRTIRRSRRGVAAIEIKSARCDEACALIFFGPLARRIRTTRRMRDAMAKPDFIYVDGAMVPYAEATIHVASAAAKYGTNVFEGICAYEGNSGRSFVFRLREHLVRLHNSVRMMQIECDYGDAAYSEAVLMSLRENRIRGDAHIRLTVFITGEGYADARGPASLVCIASP